MNTVSMANHHLSRQGISPEQKRVIVASSLGTVFEWYEFFLYASLSATIAKHFFSGANPTAAFIFALIAFAAGFVIRPFGAVFFGRVGDLIGRKYTFLVTIILMGLSTIAVGLLPTYATIGIAAPIFLLLMRLIQGLAIGGEYGGAVVYVAEHAPTGKRGFFTSFIQITPAVGLLLSILIIQVVRTAIGEDAFQSWGWRIPFLLALPLLGISVWIRLKMDESPVFQKMKAEGTLSKAPLREVFASSKYLKVTLIALFGGVAGQAVVWQTAQLYTLFFLTQTLRLDGGTTNILVGIMLLCAVPLFIFFGWLSDRIGRKPIIIVGCALAVLTYFPLFGLLAKAVNPALIAAQTASPVTLSANPANCSFQFNPVGSSKLSKPCDVAKAQLARSGVNYHQVDTTDGTVVVKIGATAVDAASFTAVDGQVDATRFSHQLKQAIASAGYPEKAVSEAVNYPLVVLILVLLVSYGTMVFGPIAAQLVELFPSRIRYTGVSFPYHVGNGWFGGLLPTASFAIVAATGDMYAGLWYPVTVAAMTFLVALFFMPETKDRNLDNDADF